MAVGAVVMLVVLSDSQLQLMWQLLLTHVLHGRLSMTYWDQQVLGQTRGSAGKQDV